MRLTYLGCQMASPITNLFLCYHLRMQTLIDSISQYISPSSDLIECLFDRIKPVSFDKGEMVHDAHEVCKNSFFIVSGIFRLYYIKPDGREVSEFFATEKEWINSPVSFMQQKPDVYFMDAIEDSSALALDVEDLVYLFDHFPEMERYSRLDMGAFFGHLMNRLASLRFTTAEKKYNHFCMAYGDVKQRIPLHMVASYMGVTQETLSRIRTKNK